MTELLISDFIFSVILLPFLFEESNLNTILRQEKKFTFIACLFSFSLSLSFFLTLSLSLSLSHSLSFSLILTFSLYLHHCSSLVFRLLSSVCISVSSISLYVVVLPEDVTTLLGSDIFNFSLDGIFRILFICDYTEVLLQITARPNAS